MGPLFGIGGASRLLFVGLCSASLALGACAVPTEEHLGTARAAGSTAFPNDQIAFDYFRGKGFTSVQAAGIVGNLDQESGIDPTISQQGGGPGRGIAQWSAGGRWDTDPGDNLVAFAAQAGQSQDSLGVQLDFIMFELQTFPAYGLTKLQATTNVTDAATEFELDFEGCGIPSQCDVNSRISYAQSVLDAYGNDPVQTDGGTSSEDAGTTSDAAKSAEGGSLDAGGGDGAPHGGGDAALPPIQVGDAGGAPGASGPGTNSSDGGETASAAPNANQLASGCTVAVARSTSGGSGVWLAAIGVVVGIARRRRGSKSGPTAGA